MQQERYAEDDVKIDRERIQQENNNMKNRGLDYSPRFKSASNLRMTGSGDNRPTSPTLALHSRISGKEKRRRVHAWLGAQVRSETGNLATSPAICSTASKMQTLPVPELPSFATFSHPNTESRADNLESKDGSDLLHSKSEFVPGTLVPAYPTSTGTYQGDLPLRDPLIYQGNYANGSSFDNRHQHTPLPTGMSSNYTSNEMNPGSKNVIGKAPPSYDAMKPNFSGGGDNYCYVYDPLVAKAYTKKYPISPSINTPPPSTRNDQVPKFVAGSLNFTPSSASHLIGASYTRPSTSGDLHSSVSRHDFNKYTQPLERYSSQDYVPVSYAHDISFPLPTKYEEYDMRPIKPLDADVKKSWYGDNNTNTSIDPYLAQKSQKPKPYLRRSHSTNVSYPAPAPRPDSRSKEHHIQLHAVTESKPVPRVQTNVENKRKVSHLKGSPLPSPKSPRRMRQQKYSSVKNKKLSGDKLKQKPANEESESEDKIEEKDDKALTELPVDLKHVKAATKIQAVWKGYRTRRLNPKVVEIRQEVRARRAEQYISVLCHEVQCLKENLETEKKMRDLQTEAIRYIWSQLRTLQKQNSDKSDSRRERNGRKKSPEGRKPRSKSSSPRRLKNKNKKSASHSSPLGTPTGTINRNSTNKNHNQASDSSALDFDDDTDSIESLVNRAQAPKQADVSWKEVPDDDLYKDRGIVSQQCDKSNKQNMAEDTDEGRGTLVTDGEGNPAHSSPEDNDVSPKVESKIAHENLHLKSTIDVLQDQVAQLQEAMLSLSDRILNRSRSDVNLDDWGEADELKLITESQDISASPPEKLVIAQPCIDVMLESEPALSARGEVPKVSLKNALTTLRSALSEPELWALCEQAGHSIKNKTVKRYLALETTYVRKDGRIEFSECTPEDVDIDEMYLAPEILENNSANSEKSSVFSLSVVLWSAADWEMSAEQAPQLSQELESLLVVMSQDDVAQRAEVDDVIKICEDHHAKTGVNSLCVCSSLFAEVQDAFSLSNSGKLNHKKIALDISREQGIFTKKLFKESVVPDINTGNWRSALKPASQRVLSPRFTEEPSPHEKLMTSLSANRPNLRKSPRPKVFGVRDMFLKNPDLVQKLNILPGQRRKNQKVMRLVMRRQSPKDPASPPVSGIPTAPRALRVGVSDNSVTRNKGLSSVILRWHPAKIFDKHGQEAKPDKIMGYRIYVNGHPKGMVAGTKSRALLEGLRPSTEYRVHVQAVSALGESDSSNTVIAHITSSPLRHNCDGNEDFEMEESESIADNQIMPKKTKAAPVAPPRKSGTLPQPKPRLGAVFPKQTTEDEGSKKKVKQDDDVTDSTSSEKSESKNGDDIIDRVLRRYGIQQTAAIVPGYASGSTLSPMPGNYKSKSCTSTETNRRSLQNSLLDDLTKSLETSSLSSKASTTSDSAADIEPKNKNFPTVSSHSNDFETSANQPTSEVTSKSLALLAQLKCDLLN